MTVVMSITIRVEPGIDAAEDLLGAAGIKDGVCRCCLRLCSHSRCEPGPSTAWMDGHGRQRQTLLLAVSGPSRSHPGVAARSAGGGARLALLRAGGKGAGTSPRRAVSTASGSGGFADGAPGGSDDRRSQVSAAALRPERPPAGAGDRDRALAGCGDLPQPSPQLRESESGGGVCAGPSALGGAGAGGQ